MAGRGSRPDGRKAGGVYYTPAPLARRVVEDALGAVLERSSLEEAGSLRILDPACGAGAMLLCAHERLERWYLEKYRHLAEPPPGVLVDSPDGEPRLTLEERKRILAAHLFGVDRDPAAVEATRRALLARVPGAGAESTLLDGNLRCGNFLTEAAPEGERFDAIVGNPPYLNLKRAFLPEQEKRRLESTYSCARGQYDAFVLFIERSLEKLAAGGRLSFVLPKPILASENYEPVRRLVLDRGLEVIRDCGRPFRDAGVEAVVLTIGGGEARERTRLERFHGGEVERLGGAEPGWFEALPFTAFSYLLDDSSWPVVRKLLSHPGRLGSWLGEEPFRGLELGKGDPSIGREPTDGSMALLRGEDVGRYRANHRGLHVSADGIEKGKGGAKRRLFDAASKVLVRRVSNGVVAAVDDSGSAVLNTLYVLLPAERLTSEFLAGALNSSVVAFFMRTVFLTDDKLFPYIRLSQLRSLPVFDPSAEEVARVTGLVREPGRADESCGSEELDLVIARGYGLTTREFEAVRAFVTAGAKWRRPAVPRPA